MLLRQEPKNKNKLLAVTDSNLNTQLQIKGFAPRYYWDKVFYYIKSDMLAEFLEERREC